MLSATTGRSLTKGSLVSLRVSANVVYLCHFGLKFLLTRCHPGLVFAARCHLGLVFAAGHAPPPVLGLDPPFKLSRREGDPFLAFVAVPARLGIIFDGEFEAG